MGLRFLDLFAGIGGFRLGMERAGHECVGYVEFDKFARKSYKSMHDVKGEWTAHDITTVPDEHIRSLNGRVDVICGGFPCQSFSIAGKRGGFDDTRGTLFFEIVRFANIIRPQYLFLENVKGLLNHDSGNTFETILRTLDELGYDAEWDLLNSKDFGVPQNRERVFIIGHLRGASTRKIFPIGGENNATLEFVGMLDIKGNESIRRVYGAGGISPNLTTMQGGNREPKVLVGEIKCINPRKDDGSQTYQQDRVYGTDGNMVALSSQLAGRFNIVTPEKRRIRKLTPKECFRLQGFPDELFERAAEVNSDSQLYKQVGNSVTVNAIHAIAERLEV